MTRRTVVDCDRCGEPVPEADRAAGRAYAATISGVDVVGTSTTPADLCGSCLVLLARFMAGAELKPEKAT